MTPGGPRWLRISRGIEHLTAEDIAEGWHFCPDFDEDLVGPEARDENGSCRWCGYDPEDPV